MTNFNFTDLSDNELALTAELWHTRLSLVQSQLQSLMQKMEEAKAVLPAIAQEVSKRQEPTPAPAAE